MVARRIPSPRRDVFLWKSKAEVGGVPGTLSFSFLFEQWKWASEASKEPSLQMLSDIYLFIHLMYSVRKKTFKTKDIRRGMFGVVSEHLAFVHLASVS